MTRAYGTSWGAQLCEAGVRYRFWAPAAKRVSVLVLDARTRRVPMEPLGGGWYACLDPGSRAGTRYLYEIDGAERVPDPAARFAPDGPRGAGEVIDPAAFRWPDRTPEPRAFHEMVFYELNVGAFTPSGTYAEAALHLEHLAELGVTAVELMPLAERPGTRNWGYDGVLMYAPAHRYGRPEDLKRFIVAAHERGLAVFLDVVYNHFGPQDNYLHRYAPQFFTESHHTPWGAAIDYGNAPVRRYVLENASYWLCEYGFDGLRLDAVQTIFDEGVVHVLEELAVQARRDAGRPVFLVLENDRNDAQWLVRGYDAQWNDDVHHCLHVVLTGESDGYYQDYIRDPVGLLGRALTQGFAFQGEDSPFRGGEPRGTPSAGLPLSSFVNFLQNHDQVGNRAFGERIDALAAADAVRAAAAIVLLAPSPPLLFMGEEWAASRPFLFFCDFEPALAKAVTEGRRREFARFARFADPFQRERIPDPGDVRTFERSQLDWSEPMQDRHRSRLELYRELLRVRREEIVPHTAGVSGRDAVYELRGTRGLEARWRLRDGARLVLEANLSARPQSGFAPRAEGRVLHASHELFEDGVAPAWSVRWSLA
jgi:maltooligosyltrehalose trehalohydrolase